MSKITLHKSSYTSALVFLGLWQLASFFTSPVILPAPGVVLWGMGTYLTDSAFYADLGVTVFRGSAAYLLSAAAAMVLAFIIHYSKTFERIFYPYLLALQVIPRISWILLAMIWFPLNSQIVIFIILMTILPVITINTLEGLKGIDGSLLEMARVFKIKKSKITTGIILPGISSHVFSGLKVAMGITWKTVVMAELLTVQNGLGAEMAYAKTSFSTDRILSLTLMIVMIGLLFQKLLLGLERHFERWKYNHG
ncbi:MAG: hypothetical protein AVO33_10960 [delta proteobacterium ML8_F1]|nr:MAG: hypothetical protein AVO33_10960 [delta proteobacterium ML8_F1]